MTIAHALANAGHLAVWVGFYVAGMVICLSHLTGAPLGAAAMMCAFFTGQSVYLIDRIKVHDRWIDPADRHAFPERFNFLWAHRRRARVLIVLLALAGIMSGFASHAVAGWASLLGVLGVSFYSRRVPLLQSRPKDIFIFKNLTVAVGMTAFGFLLIMPVPADRDVWAALAFVASVVFADAVLCDLDDRRTDVRYGTQTIPGRHGAAKTWATALAATFAGAMLLLATGPGRLGSLWAGLVPLTSLALARRRGPIRDWVDLRLPVVAMVVTILA